jgi:hypothetical protein
MYFPHLGLYITDVFILAYTKFDHCVFFKSTKQCLPPHRHPSQKARCSRELPCPKLQISSLTTYNIFTSESPVGPPFYGLSSHLQTQHFLATLFVFSFQCVNPSHCPMPPTSPLVLGNSRLGLREARRI